MDDCDPKTLFSNIPTNEEHIFDYFAAQGANNQEEDHQETYEGEEEEEEEDEEEEEEEEVQVEGV